MFDTVNVRGTVGYVKLYDARTGGNLIKSQQLNRTASSITVDERVDKWRYKRLVMEFNCKAS